MIQLEIGLYKILFCPWAFRVITRINTILCPPTLCLGTPPPPVVAHTIAQYNGPPRLPVIAIYTTHYWQWQYRIIGKLETDDQRRAPV